MEPNASSISERFKSIEHLSKNGIYTGITLMPLLPFFNDTKENISEIVKRAKDAGCSYIIPMFGLTLRKGSREHLYNFFDKEYPHMTEKYENTFGEQYNCMSPQYKSLYSLFYEEIGKAGITPKMDFYTPKENKQLNLF